MSEISIDWSKLKFEYTHTKSHIKYVWKNGQWDHGVLVKDASITMDVAGFFFLAPATALNYGQSCFEGQKAVRMRDGKVRIFRPELNAKRLELSCETCSLPAPPIALFLEALQRVVADNIAFVPPVDVDGSLYIRPVVFGSGPQLGLSPAKEVTFIVYVNPVGSYYASGMGAPMKALIAHDLDRATENGTGSAKVAGNYAPVFGSTKKANAKGFGVNLFLDSKTKSFVEEFATSNFAAIEKKGSEIVYVTPRSKSILAGITNRSLAELASRELKWKVERREVSWEEVKSGKFAEVVAAGTAVIMSPIGEIHREFIEIEGQKRKRGSSANYDWDLDEYEVVAEPLVKTEVVTFNGEVPEFHKLFNKFKALQKGDLEGWQDYKWMWPSEGI